MASLLLDTMNQVSWLETVGVLIWGDGGYIRMKRGRNICGIAEQASFPVVK